MNSIEIIAGQVLLRGAALPLIITAAVVAAIVIITCISAAKELKQNGKK